MEKYNSFFLNRKYNISLYIHIPFCRSKCYYCDFFSIKHSDELSRAIVKAIIKQYRYYISKLPDVELSTIYIGGGTPSIVNYKILELLFYELKKNYLNNNHPWNIREWTVEANPESLSEDFIKVCNDHGITRLSLGVQSLHDEYLNILGRPGNSKDIYRAIALLQKHWKGDVNYDILSGIPYRSQETDNDYDREKILLYDLNKLIGTNPGHISLYTLTVEKNTELYRLIKEHKYKAMNIDRETEEWLKSIKLLKEKGYYQYEVSNFSKPGKECIHNIRYWNMEPYLGLGPSAVSTMPLSEGSSEVKIARITGQHNISKFIRDTNLRNPNFFNSGIEIVPSDDFLFENLMMGFRMKKGISRKTFIRRFGASLEVFFPELFKKMEKDYLLKKSYKSYTLTEKGFLTLNTILINFQKYMELPSLRQIQVQWPQDTTREI